MGRRQKIRTIYCITLGGILLWLTAIFLAPYLKNRGSFSSLFVYTCFSPLCHQIPSRSFLVFGHSLAVCARCLGVYFGFLAGTVFYPFLRGFQKLRLPRIEILGALSLPVFIDAAGNLLGLWKGSNILRFSTGFLWGTIFPFYLIPGLAEVFIRHERIRF